MQRGEAEFLSTNVIDRVWLNSTDAASRTVHAEIELLSSIDLEDLNIAVMRTAQDHRMLTARLDVARDGWLLGDKRARPPIAVSEVHPARLSTFRSSLVSQRLDLCGGDPVRFYLTKVDGLNRVFVVGDHAVFDGIALRHIVSSLIGNLLDESCCCDDRDWRSAQALSHRRESPERVDRVVSYLRSVGRANPVRIGRGVNEDASGYGVVCHAFSASTVSLLWNLADSGSTVNDILVTSIVVSIIKQNDERQYPSLPITVGVPVNLRPHRTWDSGVFNAALPWPVHLNSCDRTELLNSVSTQMKSVRAGLLATDIRSVLSYLENREGIPLWILHGMGSMTTMISSIPGVGVEWRNKMDSFVGSIWGGAPASPWMTMTFAAMVDKSGIGISVRYCLSDHSQEQVEMFLSSVELEVRILCRIASAVS